MTEDELILTHILQCSRSEYYLHKPQLTLEQKDQYQSYKQRRLQGEPLQYILGNAPFMDLELKVTPAVLIPRPETEMLVQAAMRRFEGDSILEIGTGSGNIAIMLARQFPFARITSLDISPDALNIAQENARAYEVLERITFLQQDIRSYEPDGLFDLVISNPPYIPLAQMSQLPEDVKQEPRLALEAGPDGLEFYRIIIKLTPGLLRNGAWLMMEHGDGQELAIKELLLKEHAFSNIQIIQDLAGKDRIICVQKT